MLAAGNAWPSLAFSPSVVVVFVFVQKASQPVFIRSESQLQSMLLISMCTKVLSYAGLQCHIQSAVHAASSVILCELMTRHQKVRWHSSAGLLWGFPQSFICWPCVTSRKLHVNRCSYYKEVMYGVCQHFKMLYWSTTDEEGSFLADVILFVCWPD